MFADRAARAFPVLLLASLAALAAWLNTATEFEALMPPREVSKPDSIMQDTSTIAFAENGQPLYQLRARTLRHIPEDDVSILEDATLVRTVADTPDMTVTSKDAKLTERGQLIEFKNDVHLVRSETPQSEPLEITTSLLTVNTQAGTAKTSQMAQAISPSQQIRSQGLEYDHGNARLTLKSKVQITHAPIHR